VGGVLVDDDDAVAGLGDDVGAVHLGPGGAEGKSMGSGDPAVDHRGGDCSVEGPARQPPPFRPGHAEPRLAGRPVHARPAGLMTAPEPPDCHAEKLEGGRRCRAAGSPPAPPAAGGRGPVPGPGQRVAQAADDQAADQRRIAEPHLGLGRVDVHVDVGGSMLDEQGRRRMAVAGQEVGIGGAQGPLQQAVAHRAAVDEQILVGGVASE
jgi:hypothetical protein